MSEMRLQKYIALCGIASRRKAEELITQGRVKVNGLVVVDMGYKVTKNDKVKVDNKNIKLQDNYVYIMLNKPEGYVTTSKDQFERPVVLDLIKGVKERVYPVGRLDYNTTGLVLITNDGEVANRLTHPSHEIDKVYMAKVKGFISPEERKSFEEGLVIEGVKTAPSKLNILRELEKTSLVEIIIHEGRNRQIRKMCDKIGHPVLTLKRILLGKIKLGSLEIGEWRYLSKTEIEYLKGL